MIENITIWESIIVAGALCLFAILCFAIETIAIFFYWRFVEFRHQRKDWQEALELLMEKRRKGDSE